MGDLDLRVDLDLAPGALLAPSRIPEATQLHQICAQLILILIIPKRLWIFALLKWNQVYVTIPQQHQRPVGPDLLLKVTCDGCWITAHLITPPPPTHL